MQQDLSLILSDQVYSCEQARATRQPTPYLTDNVANAMQVVDVWSFVCILRRQLHLLQQGSEGTGHSWKTHPMALMGLVPGHCCFPSVAACCYLHAG